MKALSLGLMLMLAVSTVAFADGKTIYENGNADFLNGNEMTQWLQAEDFMLTGPNLTVNGAEIDVLDAQFTPFESTMEYFIFADNGGIPGAVLATGVADSVNVTDLGVQGGFQFWNFDWKFDAPVDLAANTRYHFGVHNDDDYADREDRYWATTAPNGTNTGNESQFGTMDNWFNNGTEHAFSLQGIPEPTTVGLLALGALGVIRRRR